MVYAVPIQPIRVQKPDYDTSSLIDALQGLRDKRTGEAVAERLSGNDLRGAATAAVRGGDSKTGMRLLDMDQLATSRAESRAAATALERERQQGVQSRFDQQQAAARDEKARQYVLGMLSTLDPEAPDFGARWGGHLKQLRTAGYKVGPEYDDPAAGYQMALTEVLGPKGVIDRRDKERARRTAAEDEAPIDTTKFGMDADGRIVPLGGETAPRVLSSREAMPDSREVVPHPDAARSPAVESDEVKRQRLERDIETQKRFIQHYGKPNRGFRYVEGPDGVPRLVDMREGVRGGRGGGGEDKTRKAILGALSASEDAIADVEAALKNTDVLGRGASALTGSGTYSRALGPARIAIRGVLHGISGAQVNIPEQAEYFETFLPKWNDGASTIEFKLNHLKFMLGHIKKATGANFSEDSVKEVRNEMRKGLGLKPLKDEGGTSGATKPDQRQLLQEARDAIAKGADKEAVRRRLKSMGYDLP